MFEKPKRLSVYVQCEFPETLTEISMKLADQLMIRLDVNRDLLEVRNLYTFFIMYSFLTKDLYLFSRIFISLENVQAIFTEAINLITTPDHSIKPELLAQFIGFYNEQQKVFNISRIALSKTLENKYRLASLFDDACHVVAKEYLDVATN
jgi:hypothetical protein